MAGQFLDLRVQLSLEGLPFGFAPLRRGVPALVVLNSNLPWFGDGDCYYRRKPHKKGSGSHRSRTPTEKNITPGEDIGGTLAEKNITPGEDIGGTFAEKNITPGEDIGGTLADKNITPGEDIGGTLAEKTITPGEDIGGTHKELAKKKSTVKELSPDDVKEILIQHVIDGGLGDWAGLVRKNEALKNVADRITIRDAWRTIAEKKPDILARIVKEMKLKGSNKISAIEALLDLALRREALKTQQTKPTGLPPKSQDPKIKANAHLSTPLLKSQDKGKAPARDSKEVNKVKIRLRGPRLETTAVDEMDKEDEDFELYCAMEESQRVGKVERKAREKEAREKEKMLKKGESSRAP